MYSFIFLFAVSVFLSTACTSLSFKSMAKKRSHSISHDISTAPSLEEKTTTTTTTTTTTNNPSLAETFSKDSIQESKNLVKDVVVVKRPEVEVWIRYFTGRGRDRMKIYLERSYRYKKIMSSVLTKHGLPENLVYVAMIESGFNPKARSRANAMGYWQFIEATGRRYGLRMNYLIDERRDPVLSTRAAVKYLRDLHNLFGSWYLAMASYNAGEYRVNRAMMRHYTRDFWRLRDKKSLPRETREYIPKFMAAQLISQNPKQYGFEDLNYQEPMRFEFATIRQSISLKKLAKALSVPYKELQMLNPKYITEYAPLEKEGSTVLRVPIGFSEKITPQMIVTSSMRQPKASKHFIYYKVRWGDTLYRLAIRHRTTINTIARMNGLSRRNKLRAGQVIKLPPLYGRRHITKKTKRLTTFHTVKKGDNLNRVARVYGVSIAQLKKWNRIPASGMIYPKQKLRVRADQKLLKTHIVKKGDTLISIAKQYKVPLIDLMQKNALTFKSIIQVGRTIVIPE